jgi:sulfoxide reductase heme-binding subunit YedZ
MRRRRPLLYCLPMGADGGTSVLHGDAVRLRGFSFGGRVQGALADPIAQLIALILAISIVFSLFPTIDLWFSGLFAYADKGFPLQDIAAFDAFGRLGILAVAGVLVAVLVAIVWRLLHPDAASPLPPNAIVFALASFAAISTLTPVVLIAAESGRLPPAVTHPFGGHDEFVALWQGGGACSTECAAFSVGTMWAVWLVAAAAFAPIAWRRTALTALASTSALLALNTVARGEAFLSGALLSATFSLLVMAIVYRFTIAEPLPRLADDRLEADLTRAGHMLRDTLGAADWDRIAAKAQSPWRDRLGRISPLKAATFGLVVLPGAWLLWLAMTGELTPLPWVFLIYNSGIWAIWLFLASLAVTPARHIFGWSELIAVRRMLGIGGLAFTVLHLADYVWLDRFSIGFIVNEYLTRPTIWMATLATVGIFILGATSFDDVIRRMGSAAWNRLHYLAYPAIGLAILHFDMSPASLGGPPFLITGMFIWLMAWRVLHRYGVATDPLVLLALGLAVALASFLFEVVWLALYQGVPVSKTVGFTFDLTGGLAPSWQLLILGPTAAALAAIFGRKSRSRARLKLRRDAGRASPLAGVKGFIAALQIPLRDRAGRFSTLKATTFALLFMPAIWFAWLAATDGLTPQPFGFVIYNSGVWAMWFLLASLAITPARHILDLSELIAVRRMIGLAGAAYTLFHVVIYFLLDRTSWASVAMDLQRATILVAIASTILLVILAATSFDGAIRRLGARNWHRLHYVAYPAVGLALLHFDMGPESLGGTPFVITGLYFWVMGWRGLALFGNGTNPPALLALTFASTTLSFAFEAAWIRYYRGFAEFGTSEELWQFGLGLAATWQVLLVGLAATALGSLFSGRRAPARVGPFGLRRGTRGATSAALTAADVPAE